MARMPLIRTGEGATGLGRCDPPAGRREETALTMPRPASPSLADLIPLEWVGLTMGSAPVPPSSPSRIPVPTVTASVIASPADAALLHVTPVPGLLERGRCVVEPGKACRSSGRCRQLGH